jgi:hypothetical protein
MPAPIKDSFAEHNFHRIQRQTLYHAFVPPFVSCSQCRCDVRQKIVSRKGTGSCQATSYLRNVQYEMARRNFHLRAFGGYGRPRTTGVWRLWRYRLHSVLRRVLGKSGGLAASTARFFKTVRGRLAWLAQVVVESTHKIKRTTWFQFVH